MSKVTLLFGLLLSVSLSVTAQDFPRADLFVGYTYDRTYNSNGDTSSSNGGTAAVAFYPNKWLGLVADFGGSTSSGFTDSSGSQVNASSHSFHYLFGPRVRFGNERITPFVQALFGGVSRSAVEVEIPEFPNGFLLISAQTSFGLAAGGGVDFKVAHHFAIRAIQAEYMCTRFNPVGANNTQNHVNLSTGIVFH